MLRDVIFQLVSPRSRWVALLVPIALVSSGFSAELVVRNLHMDLELLPSDFDYEVDDGVTKRSGSDSFDSAVGLAVGARYSFASTGDSHGFLVGGQITVAQAAYDSYGHLTDYGIRAEGGYGYAFNDLFTFNFLLRLGYSWATLDLAENDTFSSLSLTGSGLSYGAAVGVDFQLTDRWQLNSAVGYHFTSFDLSGNNVDATIDRSGFCISIGFLYRLSNQPSPLE